MFLMTNDGGGGGLPFPHHNREQGTYELEILVNMITHTCTVVIPVM